MTRRVVTETCKCCDWPPFDGCTGTGCAVASILPVIASVAGGSCLNGDTAFSGSLYRCALSGGLAQNWSNNCLIHNGVFQGTGPDFQCCTTPGTKIGCCFELNLRIMCGDQGTGYIDGFHYQQYCPDGDFTFVGSARLGVSICVGGAIAECVDNVGIGSTTILSYTCCPFSATFLTSFKPASGIGTCHPTLLSWSVGP